MYRINSVLSKPAIVRPRFQASQTRNFVSGNISKRNCKYGRHMSTASNSNKATSQYVGYSVVAGVLFGTSVTLAAKYNDEFRHSLESTIPFSKQAFNYLIPLETAPVVQDESLPSPLSPPQEVESLEDGDAKNGHLVVNIMDTPTASAIDLELGKEPQIAADSIEKSQKGNDVSVEDESVNAGESLGTVVHELEKEALEAVVETAVDMIEDIIPVAEPIIEKAKEVAELPCVSEKIDKMEEIVVDKIEEKVVELAEDISAFIEAPLSLETTGELPAATPADDDVVLTADHLNTVLKVAYENLRIILDDTVTTKTSAAGMLHGYITQFGQALLIARDDPAYESVWKAAATLEHNVKESVALVKAKEAEAKVQMEKLLGLIGDVRGFGANDIADKAESLIAISGESLHWGETEMELANNKLNFLHDFQRRVEGSPGKLKVYLDEFTPDLIELLKLEKFVDAQNLTSEDALLMLSLKRPELIYAEVKLREKELEKEFKATLDLQKDELLKQAEKNLNDALEILALSKDNEMKVKTEELITFHANHLQEELKAQAEANQLAREMELVKQAAELTSKHEEEMAQKLNLQEEEHQYNISRNLSSLRGIQAKISEVVDLSAQQHHNQNLWAAAQTLSSGLCNISEDGRTGSLLPALIDVKQLSKDDDVMAAIIDSVPRGAADMGVVPEDLLVQRFSAVKRACMRVAAVKDGSILSYVFSYIKSMFVISRYYQRHVDAEVDINKIGPYEILEKADFYMQQGDLVQAAKFMSLLNGIPKKLCADWLNEVRLLLETKQSVNLLLAYAGSYIAESK